MLVKYVRLPVSRQPIGCIIGLQDGRIGWSQCNPRDRFSKKVAKAIALTRATHGFPHLKDDNGNPIPFEPVKVKLNHPDLGKVQVDLFSAEIERMKDRIVKYLQKVQ